MNKLIQLILPAISAAATRRGLFPRFLPHTLAGYAAQHGLPSQWAADMFSRMKECADAIKERHDGMSSTERADVKLAITTNGGLALLSGGSLPSFDDVRTPFPLPSVPLPPVSLPPFPNIPLPNLPGVNATSLVDKITDRVTGLVGGVLQTVKDVVTQLPFDAIKVIDKFVDRVTTVGELVKSGRLDQAIARLVESVVLLARDVVTLALATVANLVVDVGAGVIGGLYLARALTPAERDFAHAIFHGRINLTFVRVALMPKASGLTSANVIYMPSLNLNEAFDRARFAHELTHVYQDQTVFDPGTLHAAHEFLNHYFGSGRHPYKVALTSQTNWAGLGVEQQAQVVENWQSRLDRLNGVSGAVDPIPPAQVPFYQAVFSSEGLF